MTITRVIVIKTAAAWYEQIRQGLDAIDRALQARGCIDPDGADIADALSCWTADPEAFTAVVQGLVALNFPVAEECVALAGYPLHKGGEPRDR